MCDTLVALGNATEDGSVLFAKNSDRDPNEAHQLLFIPRAEHLKGSTVHCTYIDIPQVEHTHAVLLAMPYWIWGAEMGANDQGVAIGNEAVFSKEPYGKVPGLLGMDFLRLALERGSSAYEAMMVIIKLVEQYGQSGNCSLGHKLYYHNSFLIADRSEAWVLETVGKLWVAEKVKDVRSISNRYTIQEEWDMASPDLVKYALDRKWSQKSSVFNFAKSYSDFIYTTFADGKSRQCFTSRKLNEAKGKINLQLMMSILRSHQNDLSNNWVPDKGVIRQDVCAHAGFGPIRISQTTGSMVSRLAVTGDTHWVTGTSTPCTSIFKPVWLDAGLPEIGDLPGKEYDQANLWWRHELLQRKIQCDYPARISIFAPARDQLENAFIQGEVGIRDASSETRKRYSQECFDKSRETEENCLKEINQIPVNKKMTLYHSYAWKKFNKQANISVK